MNIYSRTRSLVETLGDVVARAAENLGDLTIFSGQVLSWLLLRRPAKGTLLQSFYTVGVLSMPVVAVTGLFIGMVLGVQGYHQFHSLGLATRLGSIINISIVSELGPVLAATMIAGRVGSAMAAEIGTMAVTDQIDALTCLGVNPLHYLAVPRFVACVLLIPMLTILADLTGICGGAMICINTYGVDAHHYWTRARNYVGLWDISEGLIKSAFFGAAIALISCHRGFRCRAGAEGVGRAATEAFVASFIAILILDFFLALLLGYIEQRLWPNGVVKLL
ncbi:MAG: ABC transporter permease [Gemmatales bacterium]|nr:MAG: ABC transporter permease [Gemmatales bacterium]